MINLCVKTVHAVGDNTHTHTRRKELTKKCLIDKEICIKKTRFKSFELEYCANNFNNIVTMHRVLIKIDSFLPDLIC